MSAITGTHQCGSRNSADHQFWEIWFVFGMEWRLRALASYSTRWMEARKCRWKGVDFHGWTLTLTKALVQQHRNPRPPSPDQSLATTSRMYSPGSLNFTVVVDRPLNAAVVLPSIFSTAGLALAKTTSPGPRNLLHVSTTGGVPGGFAPG